MIARIIRGAVIGIFLGVIFGVAISSSMHLSKLIERNNESILTAEQQASQVFNVDDYLNSGYSAPSLYTDDYDEDLYETSEALYTEVAGATDAVYNVNYNPPECTDLEDVILRFHVRAHSNRQEDIDLKYAVRDAVLTELGGEMNGDMSRDEVLTYLNENLEKIKDIALNTIHEAGYGYTVKVYISNDYFPIRQYGEMVIPAGVYQALRIDIGLAEGENFWCLLYPMMCYTVDSGAIVSKEDGERLASELTEEQYEKLFIDRDVEDNEIEVRFKLLEWLGL